MKKIRDTEYRVAKEIRDVDNNRNEGMKKATLEIIKERDRKLRLSGIKN